MYVLLLLAMYVVLLLANVCIFSICLRWMVGSTFNRILVREVEVAVHDVVQAIQYFLLVV